jgi:hypothetical protein
MQVSHQRTRTHEREGQSFRHPVRRFDDIDIQSQPHELEVARDRTLDAECGCWKPAADLRKDSSNAAAVQVHSFPSRIFARLTRDARENVNLMAASSKGPRHCLHVRSDSSAPGLRRVFPREEEDAKCPVGPRLCVDVAHRCAAASTTFRGIG